MSFNLEDTCLDTPQAKDIFQKQVASAMADGWLDADWEANPLGNITVTTTMLKAAQQIAAPPEQDRGCEVHRQLWWHLFTSTNDIKRWQSASSSTLSNKEFVWNADNSSNVSYAGALTSSAKGTPSRVETDTASYSSCGKHNH